MTGYLSEIIPGLYRWQSGLNGVHQPVNSYLWQSSQGLILIDPAADLTREIVQQVNASAVSDIFVTHLQEEHIAGCRNFPVAHLHVPAGDEYLNAGAEAYYSTNTTWQPPWEWETRGNYRGHLAGARNERPPQEPLREFQTIHGGDSICGLRVLATPGHGKHALTLLAEIDGKRVTFCGDLIYGDGRLWNWFDCDWDYGFESGQHALRDSVASLQSESLDLLCPAHGPIVDCPAESLAKLHKRIDAVLTEPMLCDSAPLNFPERDSPARGWRELLPGLHQWRTGNCAALVSKTGNALLIDDGLCHWEPLPERSTHHRAVINDLEQSLGINKIEIVIPTHYHGDHTENIPELVAIEGTEVLSLEIVADVIEHPERYNLSAALPWYGTAYDCIPVHRPVPNGTRVQWHEYELEVFHLGGQTFYHAGIGTLVANQRVLFVGDAIYGWNTATEPILCFNDSEPQTRGWAYSVDRMVERNPDLLVCGHGSAVLNPMPLLQAKQKAWCIQLARYRELSARHDLREFFDPFLT